MLENCSRAALVAEAATRGSTTEARNATVDITGLPVCENGTGWKASGPAKGLNDFLNFNYITPCG